MPTTAPSQAEAAALCKEFRQILHNDVDDILDRMRGKTGKFVLNSDDLFKMLPRYAERPAERKFLGHILYTVAANFTDEIYRRLLARPVDDNDTVVFTAGGSATGKSTILRRAGQQPGVNFVVDTTFSNVERALAQVALALASGRKVEIHYVDRDFAESVLGMLERAMNPESGRIVPIDDMARTHFGAQQTILEALTVYRENPKVSIRLLTNRNGKLSTLSEEAFFGRLHESVDKLQREGQVTLDEFFHQQKARWRDHGGNYHAAGKDVHLPEDLYEAARSRTQTSGQNPGEGDAGRFPAGGENGPQA